MPSQSHEALRRAKFKFAGRQKIVVSRNWGFTRFARSDYVAWKKSGRLINDGVNAKVHRGHKGLHASLQNCAGALLHSGCCF